MLNNISIRNIALIEKLNIELGKGFNVLTGETGAGKSIIVDSLNLLLGERADKEMVRTGCEKGYIEGLFDITGNVAVYAVLAQLGIDAEDNSIIISRELSSEGKSVCRINGNTVTLSNLKKITDNLADIHGQHEHQLLLNKDKHRLFLDSFGGEGIFAQKKSVATKYKEYADVCKALEGDWGTDEERARRIDILEFQIDEIGSASLAVGQHEALENELQLLKSSEKINISLNSSYELLKHGSHAALDNIRIALNSLNSITGLSNEYSKLYERLDGLYYELEDAAQEIDACMGRLDADPKKMEQLEDRLDLFKKLYRKYGNGIEKVLDFGNKAQDELDRLLKAKDTIIKLKADKEKAYFVLFNECEKLSLLRKEVAKSFEKRIKQELDELGMAHSIFIVHFEASSGQEISCTADGFDTVEFLLSANAGEPARPLSKIISGGEMSRFMLALKSIAAEDAMLPTMVFDEIDTGISGRMAQVVAQKMAAISRRHQVLCVTHLPQIAAIADTHFLISKNAINNVTLTNVQALDKEDRISEIARLSGGGETQIALEHAQEMLLHADTYKKSV